MPKRAKNTRKVLALMVALMAAYLNVPLAQSRTDHPVEDETVVSARWPGMADATPLAARLAGRLQTLERVVKHRSIDAPDVERRLAIIEANLQRPADQLDQVQGRSYNNLKKMYAIRDAILAEKHRLEAIVAPIKNNIQHFGTLRNEWRVEKEQWHDWRLASMQEGSFDDLQPVFTTVEENIFKALGEIRQQLKMMLTMQENAGRVQAKLFTLEEEVTGRIMTRRRTALRDRSPPLFSHQFFDQFTGELWQELKDGIHSIDWPDSRFFAEIGWIVFLHLLLSISILTAIWRNRDMAVNESDRTSMSSRPLSVALFSGCMVTLALYETVASSDVWRLALLSVGLIAMCRLVKGTIKSLENNRLIYAVVSVIIATQLMQAIHIPLPLLRLYLVSTALAGVAACIHETRKSHHEGLYLHARLYRLFSLFLAFIIAAELIGKTKLALYLLISFISTVGVLISYAVFRQLIRAALDWLVSNVISRHAKELFKNRDAIIGQATMAVDAVLWGFFFIPTTLVIWRVYDTFGLSIKGYFSVGFNMGSQRISLGLVITAAAILYATFFVSWIVQKKVLAGLLSTRHVEIGVRHAIEKLIHYVIVLMGVLLALSVLGLDFTKITIMLSAVGVGIGFGLQGVVNNFVSGIVLLFERPVRVHDLVEIDGQWASIKRIGLRSTTVATFAGSDLVIPNANLVNNEVVNWTLSNRRARLDVPVGVAYGSDVARVIDTLTACARENRWVVAAPEPTALFLRFGESALEFELRAWVNDAENRLVAQSALHQEVDRRFREANIEIAFPQHDLHLRSIDEKVMSYVK